MNIPKLPNLRGLTTMGRAAVAAHRPEILFGTSIVTTVSAVVAAAVGGYKSGQQVMVAEHPDLDLKTEKHVPLDVKEKIQLTWMNYLPATGLTAGALGATTGLHIVHVKEKKALAAAALMAIDEVKTEARSYIDQVEKAIESNTDEETAKKIVDDSIDPEKKGEAQARVSRPGSDDEIVEYYIIRDPISGRDIWSNKVQIEEAIVEIGNQVNGSGETSLNAFYELAGWGRIDMGDDLGWNGVLPSISWTDLNGTPMTGVRDDGRPFRSFRFRPDPEKDYDRPPR